MLKTKLVLLMCTALAMAACSSAPKKSDAQMPRASKEKADTEPNKIGALPASMANTEDLAAQLLKMKNKSVYFGLDEYAIKSEQRDVVLQLANFIKAHGNLNITLQGSADERGSSEYNLALGSKRANSVLKILKMSGVPVTRIKTASLGEEYPRLTCHEEQCWKENRRVDFVGKQDGS